MNHPTPPKVWPVIHLSTLEMALRNAEIAARCGCEGVFLIQMEGRDHEVDAMAVEVKSRFPGLKVGANYLSTPAHLALVRSLTLGLDATWTDNPGIRSDGVVQMTKEAIKPVLDANPAHLFFASVAFKYQPVDENPPLAAKLANDLGLIATTSGEATGIPPSPAKLHAMRQAIGNGPLAVASGIDADNAYELGRFLTHILVATGISKSFYEFDEDALQRLMGQVADL